MNSTGILVSGELTSSVAHETLGAPALQRRNAHIIPQTWTHALQSSREAQELLTPGNRWVGPSTGRAGRSRAPAGDASTGTRSGPGQQSNRSTQRSSAHKRELKLRGWIGPIYCSLSLGWTGEAGMRVRSRRRGQGRRRRRERGDRGPRRWRRRRRSAARRPRYSGT